MKPEEVRWSRNTFDLLTLNAVWGIPRSGLIFQKVSLTELALINVMPWDDVVREGALQGMNVPSSAAALRRHQQIDFECISERFTAAGINLTDPRGLLKD